MPRPPRVPLDSNEFGRVLPLELEFAAIAILIDHHLFAGEEFAGEKLQ